MLFVFFVSSCCWYAIYADPRKDDRKCVGVFALEFLTARCVCSEIQCRWVHAATRTVRREQTVGDLGAVDRQRDRGDRVALMIQYSFDMLESVDGPADGGGHGAKASRDGGWCWRSCTRCMVAGRSDLLGMLACVLQVGKYDSRAPLGPVDSPGQYWHFLDAGWLSACCGVHGDKPAVGHSSQQSIQRDRRPG